FPNCLDSFWPAPLHFETLVAFTHRCWGFVLLGVFVHLATAAPRLSPELGRAARVALMVAVVQVMLGIGTVLTGLNTHSRATHAAVGYALWGILFFIALRSGGIRWLWDRR